jgi:hypothetical protein
MAGSLLVTACWVQPEEEVDLRDPWTIDLTVAYSSTSSCTVTGAALHLSGTLPYEALGTLDGGIASCTGDKAWPPMHRVAADIWGPTVTIRLAEPHEIGWRTTLYGEVRPERMSGEVKGTTGELLGTWFAHQGDCTAIEIASRHCWK